MLFVTPALKLFVALAVTLLVFLVVTIFGTLSLVCPSGKRPTFEKRGKTPVY